MPRRLRLSLLAVQLVSAATLLRSVAFDRWITVGTSLLLIGGALAALRGRTWGIGLVFATAVWFPVAFAIGIAPAWFCLVGLAGALPFALTLRSFARFDKGATALLALLATTAGASVAVAWKETAASLFAILPSLRPSGIPEHGALVALLAVAMGVFMTRRHRRAVGAPEATRYRIGERIRVSAGSDSERASLHEDARDDEAETGLARMAAGRTRGPAQRT